MTNKKLNVVILSYSLSHFSIAINEVIYEYAIEGVMRDEFFKRYKHNKGRALAYLRKKAISHWRRDETSQTT